MLYFRPGYYSGAFFLIYFLVQKQPAHVLNLERSELETLKL